VRKKSRDDKYGEAEKKESKREDGKTYNLLFRHTSEATAVRGLTALAGDFLDFFLGPVGEVAWVRVIRHLD